MYSLENIVMLLEQHQMVSTGHAVFVPSSIATWVRFSPKHMDAEVQTGGFGIMISKCWVFQNGDRSVTMLWALVSVGIFSRDLFMNDINYAVYWLSRYSM